MAKPSLLTHPKFRRLVRDLDIPEAHAVGLLELLWHVGYDTGNDIIGDDLDVEGAARWHGARGALCAALLRCGFIDAVAEGVFAIHDLMDHAPSFVKDRIRKRLCRSKMSGTCPQKKRTRPQKSRTCPQKSSTLTIPYPTLPNPTLPSPTHNPPTGGVGGDWFDQFWSLYPKRIDKQAARKAWDRAKVTAEVWDAMRSAILRDRETEQWTKDGGKFIPYPTTWLNRRRWEAEVDVVPPKSAVNDYSVIEDFMKGGSL